jgi:hypothetical protein
MPIHLLRRLLRTMSGTELSHVRTELERRRIPTTISPHPVQANPQLPPHRYLGNALVPTHCLSHEYCPGPKYEFGYRSRPDRPTIRL